MNTRLASEIASAYLGEFVPVFTDTMTGLAGVAWRHESNMQPCISLNTDSHSDMLEILMHEVRHHLRGDVVKPRTQTRQNAGENLSGVARSEFDRIIGDMERDCDAWAALEAAKLRQLHPGIDFALGLTTEY